MHDDRVEITLPERRAAGSLLGSRPALWTLVLFYAAYVAAGTFSSGLAVIPGIAVIFWPPVGILIATLLLNQRASWPWWIAAGCAAELTANSFLWHNPLPYAFIYYAGNALEALTAAYLISRFAPKPFRFETIEHVLSFVFLAAGIAPTVSATIISAVDAFRGRHPFMTGWPLVWVGDATGLLISAPLTFVAVQAWRERNNIASVRLLEAGTALLLMLVIAALALAGPVPTVYLTLPVLLWIATRFRLKGTAVALGLLTLMTGSFTVAGMGQFAMPSPVEHFNLVRFHVFLAVSAISALFVAALSQQRLSVLADLETANRDLERRVAERTGDLIESENRLRLAAEAAATGIWEWDLSGDRVEWTDRVFEIVGVSREEFDGTNASFIGMIHPDDLENVLSAVGSAVDGDTSAECEFRIVRPDGEIRWVHDRGRVTSDARGRRMVGTITDITERKTLEFQSRQQFEELETIYQAAPVGMAVIDRDFRFIRVNQWLATNNGLPAEDHVGRSVREVVPALADQAEPILRKVIATGEAVRDVVIEGETAAQPTVSRAWSEIWHPIKNERGETIAVNVVVEDVTESKWGERLLVEQNRLLELIAEGKPLDHILTELSGVIARLEPRTRAAVFIADKDRRVFENVFAANLPQEFLSAATGAAIDEYHSGTCGRAVSTGEPATSTHLAENDRISQQWRELCNTLGIAASHSEPILDQDGEPIGSIMLCFDTARGPDDRGLRMAAFGTHVASIAIERAEAESALRAANATFRKLVEDSPFGIYVVDADFKLAQVSAGAQKVFENVRPLIGRDFAEVLRVVWEEPFASDAIEIFRRTLETGKAYHSPRTIETRGDIGEIESYDWKLERVTMPDGRPGVVCHFYDLSERQQYEAELREAEERFRSTFEQAAVGIAHVSPDGRWLLVNERLCEITGYSRSELAELTFQQITHPDDLFEDLGHLRRMLDGTLDHYAMKKRYLRKDGSLIWVNLTVSLVRDADGSPKYFISVVEDITERKRAEDALMASEELLASTFSGVEAAIAISKVINGGDDFIVLSVNRACVDRTGVPFDKWKGSRFHDVLPAEVAEAITERYRQALREGRPIEYEEKAALPAGDIWALTTVTPLRSSTGEISRVIATSIDITERKAAEQALRESETRHRLALEAGGMGTWTMPMDGRRGYADERTLALFDVPAEEWKGDIAVIHSRRFPEDLEANSQTVTDAEGKTTWRSEFRVQHRDGSIRWLAGVARIEYGFEGAPRLMRGIYFDITERKQAEEELRRHHEILEETVRERTGELAAAVSGLQYENRQRTIVEKERQMLLSRLVAAQEEERRRIAQDLHDHLGQQLTALNMKLDLALRSAAAGDGTGHLSEARAMLRRIDDDVDALAWELRPAMLDDDGFLPALRRYVEDWSVRYRVPAEFWADDDVNEIGFLSSEVETNLYRITQEALNNIAKYAVASSVEVLLKRRGDNVVLLIQDDGAGFDVSEFGGRKLKTMGLVGMRERAGLVGGTFQIESAPGEGTTVYVQVPLAGAESSASELIRSAGS